MDNKLSKYILTTVTYYDVMDYPMTSFEIWKYLTSVNKVEMTEKCSLADVIEELGNDALGRLIKQRQGFYFLTGRDDLVEQRLERNKIAEAKFRIVTRVAFWLRFVPYVRMIGVTGRLAMKNTENKSDLDVLVVLGEGKIFTGRTLVTLLIHLLGKRRYDGRVADRICLNYFITAGSLEINLKDMFSASEYSFMVPIFGSETFREFQAENSWIKSYKPNYLYGDTLNLKTLRDSKLSKLVREVGERLLNPAIIERKLKKWEVERIMQNPKTQQQGSMIIADDESLVFLPNPQSPKVFEKFQERLNGLRC